MQVMYIIEDPKRLNASRIKAFNFRRFLLTPYTKNTESNERAHRIFAKKYCK